MRKNRLLRCWHWLSLLNWIGALTLSLLLKLPPRKLEPWFVLWSFFPRRLLCISMNLQPYMEYCCHLWADAPSCYLELLDELQTWICKTSNHSLAASLEHFAHCHRYDFGRCSSELAQLVPLPYSWGRSTRYSDKLHDFSVTIRRCYKDVYVNSFFPHTARFWNSLPTEFFPLTCDLYGFVSRINWHLLTVGSFWTDFLFALIFLHFFFL